LGERSFGIGLQHRPGTSGPWHKIHFTQTHLWTIFRK
jgi:hypothetical protein